jgi:crossover junction endodeoxyribonuclease RuvC
MFPFRAICCQKDNAAGQRGGSLKVIGIDPGLRSLGWGVISVKGSRISHVANGQCQGTGTGMADRLHALHVALSAVFTLHAPDAAAVEQVFVNSSGASTLKLGQARGIAMLVPAQHGLSVGEYAPNTIKKSVVGVGHAAKEQVQHMVRLQLPGVEFAGPDAADALAIAICHAHHLGSAAALSRAAKVRA